jgi:hypothetical protein
MANRQRGEVALTVGDRAYTMRLTTAAMAEFEDACNASGKREWIAFPECVNRAFQGSPKYMPLFIWACLLDKQPKITLADVHALVEEAGGLRFLVDKAAEAFTATAADPEDARPQTDQPTPLGTGAVSTSKPGPSA